MRTRSLLVAAAAGLLALGIAMPASADPTTATSHRDGRNPVDHRAGRRRQPRKPGQHRGRRDHQRPARPGAGQRRTQRRRRLGLGRERHLHRLHAAAGPAIAASAVGYTAGTITKVGTATYTANDPARPHRRLAGGHRDRDHRGQLRDLEPDDQRGGPRVAWPPAPTRRPSPTPLSEHLRAPRPASRAAAVPPRRASGPASRILAVLALTARASPAPRRPRRPARPSAQRPPAASGCASSTLPATAGDDPRARLYIVDHLAPGNGHPPPDRGLQHDGLHRTRRAVPRGRHHRRGLVPRRRRRHTPNDLSTWTSVRPSASDVPAGGRETSRRDHQRSERRGPRRAVRRGLGGGALGSAPGGGVIQVSRVGIRLYVSVGPGGAPAADFTIDSLTADAPPTASRWSSRPCTTPAAGRST